MSMPEGAAAVPPPVSLLAELTHRCPLQCPYCSNPLALERAAAELDTATWLRVLEEATGLGVLQTHFSGGEPTLRRDLPELIRRAVEFGQYTNLITAAVLLDEAKLAGLVEAGLDHIQISIQDSDAANADRIGGYKNGHAKKQAVARMVHRPRRLMFQAKTAPATSRHNRKLNSTAVVAETGKASSRNMGITAAAVAVDRNVASGSTVSASVVVTAVVVVAGTGSRVAAVDASSIRLNRLRPAMRRCLAICRIRHVSVTWPRSRRWRMNFQPGRAHHSGSIKFTPKRWRN